jgi:hypothetical protein
MAEDPYVMVKLRNGAAHKFDYHTFTFNWIQPIRLIDQETCEVIEIDREQIDEIFIVDQVYNECGDKDDWEVMVYLKDNRELLGFLEVSEYTVKGVSYETGEEITINYGDIKKVSFINRGVKKMPVSEEREMYPQAAGSCGSSWTTVNYQRGNVVRGIGNNGSIFVAVGDGGLIWTSSDGVDWKVRSAIRHIAGFDVIYAASKFVQVGNKGFTATSSDGISWTERSSPASTALWGIAYGAGTFVAVGNGPVIVTSANGTSGWTKRSVPVIQDLKGVVYGDGKFVAVGNDGVVITSSDGITWKHVASVPHNLKCVTFGGGIFLAGGRDATVYKSTDTVNWSKKYQGTLTTYIQALTYTGSNFVGVGTKGLAVTSSNGETWSKRSSTSDNSLMGVDYMDGRVAAGGLSGRVCLSLCNPAEASPQLIVASPNGGEQWDVGILQTVMWGCLGSVGNVKLEYTADNGDSWTTIVESTGNDGGYSWLVPSRSSSQCRVRISEAAKPTVNDESNSTFSILGGSGGSGITITQPNGGETLAGGDNYAIKWTGSTKFSSVDIEYYDGSNWNVIVNGTADDGSYSWTVPEISTSKAKIWIKGYDGSTNPTDYSDGTFTISASGGGGGGESDISVTSPSGGENWPAGSSQNITWTGYRTFSKIDIEYYDGSNWNVIVNGTADDGRYSWTVPDVTTSAAKIWIKGYDGASNPTDYSGEFTISAGSGDTVTVNSPNGGEAWSRGSTQTIKWTTTGSVGNVKIQYSANSGSSWNTIISSTQNDGSYSWQVPDSASNKCKVKISEASRSSISDISNGVFSITGPTGLVVDKARMNFGHIINGASPCTQDLLISNAGGGTMNWTAQADVAWLNVTPASGSGGAIVNVYVDPTGLGAGTYTGTITVNAPGAENSPQEVDVYLTVKNSSQDQPPFGQFATPADGTAGVSGSVPVTGWVLDDACVETVKIYRVVNGDLVFIGDSVFVEGARPDVEAAYPDYPNNTKAGWGYMMLTNFLPEGQLVLKAIATDINGKQTELGTKTITIDNANAIKPFGAIDTPSQGGEASGSSFRNNGWVLTPQPNKIPTDGSTINVFIDGEVIGKANYNLHRADIAKLFPDYANSGGSWAYLDFDTTVYENGVHTIQWTAADNAGNTDGIGSRYFTIFNSGSSRAGDTQSAMMRAARPTDQAGRRTRLRIPAPGHDVPEDSAEPISVTKGYDPNAAAGEVHPSEDGVFHIQINEVGRVKLDVSRENYDAYAGYMVVNSKLCTLPVGSGLDIERGVFSWQPGAGFCGEYQFVFIARQKEGRTIRKRVNITIAPKFSIQE